MKLTYSNYGRDLERGTLHTLSLHAIRLHITLCFRWGK